MGKRLLSAAIGIALFVAVLFLNDNYHFVFNILISVISVISIWEIFAATKYIENKALLIVSLVFAATVPFSGPLISMLQANQPALYMLFCSSL